MFSAETYQNRRKNLSNEVSNGLILLLGNIENPINFEHNTYPFRQDSSYLYYFGIKAPNIAAIIDVDEQREIIFGDELDTDALVWMGRQETLKEKSLKSGVTETLPFKDLESYLQKAKFNNRTIHFLPPYQSFNKILLSRLLDRHLDELLPSEKLIKAVVNQRSIKEPQEIEQIESALKVSTDMHLLAMQIAKPGMKEYEIVNAIQKLAADQNFRFAYPPIVTVHGEILHNQFQENVLNNGDLILNDSGAETPMGYAADLTRTFPVAATFTERQKDLYNTVLQAFTDARDLLKPGVKFKDIHLKAAKTLVEGLSSVGLMRGNAEDAVDNHAHTMFFQCGLGHMMGLDVHDMEDLGEQYVGYTEFEPKDKKTFGLKSLRLGKELQAGNVLTIEPGIYIIPDLIDIWKAEKKNQEFINYDVLESFRDFSGIRIEDNFLIEENGYRLLGPELIKTVSEIEDFRKMSLS